MYLSKNSLAKIILTATAFLLLGAVFFCAAYFISKAGISPKPTLILGIVFTSLALLSFPTGLYAEGISKPISEGNRLVKKELDPEKFLLFYNGITDKEKNAVVRHRYDMLELLLISYQLQADKKGAYSAVQLMKEELSGKYRPKAAVHCAELLYDDKEIETADKLLSGAEEKDGGSELYAMADAVRKTARAHALSDYETEEKFYSGLLSATGIFKPDNAAALLAHYRLYDVCKKTDRETEAKAHLQYCAENGGKTAVRRRAKSLL